VHPPLPAAKIQPESLSRQTPVTKQPKTPVRTTSRPSLTVNGLALSDGEKRKAIVNGITVSIGSVIEGARIEDIRKIGFVSVTAGKHSRLRSATRDRKALSEKQILIIQFKFCT
jgi:type II secretory pathway component PulC